MQIVGTFKTEGEGYLPKVGPTPLRYHAARSSQPLNLPPLPAEPKNASDAAVCTTASDSFAILAKPVSMEIPAHFVLPPALWMSEFTGLKSSDSLLAPAMNSNTNSTAVVSSASDLLNVAPEMLVDYFKPVQAPTKAAGATILVPLGFTPATPAARNDTAASRGSTATYRTP